MSQSWTDALAAGGEARAVALDISKAFERVWRARLLHILEELEYPAPFSHGSAASCLTARNVWLWATLARLFFP